MKYKLGQKVIYESYDTVNNKKVFIRDTIRGIFQSEKETLYSFVSNPYNTAWYERESDLFESLDGVEIINGNAE